MIFSVILAIFYFQNVCFAPSVMGSLVWDLPGIGTSLLRFVFHIFIHFRNSYGDSRAIYWPQVLAFIIWPSYFSNNNFMVILTLKYLWNKQTRKIYGDCFEYRLWNYDWYLIYFSVFNLLFLFLFLKGAHVLAFWSDSTNTQLVGVCNHAIEKYFSIIFWPFLIVGI